MALGVGCSESPTVSDALHRPRLEVAVSPTIVEPDEYLAQIADRIPGFAGFYVRDGVLVLRMKATVEDPEARLRTSLAADPEIVRFRDIQRLLAETPTLVEPSPYDARELWRFKTLARRAFFGLGAHRLRIDESASAIRVAVASPGDVAGIAASATALGIPDDAIIVDVRPRGQRQATLADRIRDVPGGVQINSPAGNCTIAVNAFLTESEEWGFFSASHCTSTFGVVDIYDPIFQNVEATGNVIGWELIDPELLDPGFGSCPSSIQSGCRYTDASLFLYDNNSLPDSQTIARTTNSSGSNTISSSHPRFTVSGVSVDLVYQGMGVYKIGKTGGWTAGEVLDTCEDFSDGIVLTFCAVVADYDSDAGDSGGPVFTWDGNSGSVEVVGIHFAKSGTDAFFTAWSLIQIEIEGQLTEALDFSY